MTGARTIITPFASLGLPTKTVVLTFDDGPNAQNQVTERLLDVLRRQQVTAAFCVIGKHVARHPELVRRMAADGHLIAGHSYAHPFFMLRACLDIEADLDRTDRAIGQALGQDDYHTQFFRPAGGVMTGAIEHAIHRRGLCLLPVTFLPLDIFFSPLTAPGFVRDIMRPIRRDGGALLVIHDFLSGYPSFPWLINRRWCNANRSWVPGAVDALITTLKAEGYTIGIDALTHWSDK